MLWEIMQYNMIQFTSHTRRFTTTERKQTMVLESNKDKPSNLDQLTSGTVPTSAKEPSSSVEDVGLDFNTPAKKGTYMSFLLMLIGILVSIITYKYSKDFTSSAFTNYCNDPVYESSCKANSAVLRVSLALTVLFGIQILGTFVYTPFFDFLWVIKLCGFFALMIGLFFVDGQSFGTEGYAWFARITGFFFLILQQVILIDMAYSWNESWLNRATSSDGERGCYWLSGLLIISFFFFAISLTVIGLLFWQFDQCDQNTTIISVTLGLSVVATIAQLFASEEGNLMTSSIVMLYSTYVCYCAVTLNPHSNCNPTLNSRYQTVSTVIGIILTVISLLWTTYNTGMNACTLTVDFHR
jgi:hypothetical protein